MRRDHKALTVIEVLISTAIFATVVASLFSLILISTKAAQNSLGGINSDLTVEPSISVMEREIRLAALSQIEAPGPGQSNSFLKFKQQAGFDFSQDPPVPTYSGEIEFKLIPDPSTIKVNGQNVAELLGDNIDNDEDGFVDEGLLVMVKDGVQTTLMNDVTNLIFTRGAVPKMTLIVEKQVRDVFLRDENNKPVVRPLTISRTIYIANNKQ